MERLIAHFGGFLSDHDGRGIGVAAGDGGHDGRVHDSKVF